MLLKNISKYVLAFSLLIVLAVSGYFFVNFVNKDEIFSQEGSSLTKSISEELEKNGKEEVKEEGKVISEETRIYQKFRNAIDSNDFKMVGELLGTLYENGWIKKKEFNDLEKEIYVEVDKTYFTPGDFDKSLEVAGLIYNQARFSERFRYLFILSLAALGKKALAERDYAKAEEYAMRILQITYRLEGVNLLADIYIEKIRSKLKVGKKEEAIADLNYILDFQISEDKKEILEALAIELNSAIKK